MTASINIWQPTLEGKSLVLRPLRDEHFEALFAVASDPLIWAQHPEPLRFRRERFDVFFQTAMASAGGLLAVDRHSNAIIGSSRFTGYDESQRSVEVGYTFLSRAYWGKGYNREMKALMLDHAFRFVDFVQFFVGEKNFRSRGAMRKLGAIEVGDVTSPQLDGELITSVVYQMTKAAWVGHGATSI